MRREVGRWLLLVHAWVTWLDNAAAALGGWRAHAAAFNHFGLAHGVLTAAWGILEEANALDVGA